MLSTSVELGLDFGKMQRTQEEALTGVARHHEAIDLCNSPQATPRFLATKIEEPSLGSSYCGARASLCALVYHHAVSQIAGASLARTEVGTDPKIIECQRIEAEFASKSALPACLIISPENRQQHARSSSVSILRSR